MGREDWLAVGTVLMFVAAVTVAYKLEHPKCPKCDALLAAIALGERIVCPQCGKVVSALQVLAA